MPAYLHSLGTAVPDFPFEQDQLSELFQSRFEDERTRRMIAVSFRKSGIAKRHIGTGGFFNCPPFDADGQATTADRNAVYAPMARKLIGDLGQKLFDTPGAPGREEITHVIYVTCTGFVNPGPDFFIVQDLELPENVERYVVGFMGCYGAFPAMRMATQFCEANPRAKVLVICLELCSLHMQIAGSPDMILGNTVFADGAAGLFVTANPPEGRAAYRADRFRTATIPDGESAMAWSIGNRGFDLVLSGDVPKLISAEIDSVLARVDCDASAIDRWAVHPGGKAILDRVAQSLDMPTDALDASREVLRDYGNMSSPTILFVLERMLRQSDAGENVFAVAFGPGLTVETATLERV